MSKRRLLLITLIGSLTAVPMSYAVALRPPNYAWLWATGALLVTAWVCVWKCRRWPEVRKDFGEALGTMDEWSTYLKYAFPFVFLVGGTRLLMTRIPMFGTVFELTLLLIYLAHIAPLVPAIYAAWKASGVNLPEQSTEMVA